MPIVQNRTDCVRFGGLQEIRNYFSDAAYRKAVDLTAMGE